MHPGMCLLLTNTSVYFCLGIRGKAGGRHKDLNHGMQLRLSTNNHRPPPSFLISPRNLSHSYLGDSRVYLAIIHSQIQPLAETFLILTRHGMWLYPQQHLAESWTTSSQILVGWQAQTPIVITYQTQPHRRHRYPKKEKQTLSPGKRWGLTTLYHKVTFPVSSKEVVYRWCPRRWGHKTKFPLWMYVFQPLEKSAVWSQSTCGY